MAYYPLYTKMPREDMLYPYGPAVDGSSFIVVHGGLDSPGGVFGRFQTLEEAQQEAQRLNASYRALSQEGSDASPEALRLAPHRPAGRWERPVHTLLWLGWLAAILLLVLLR